MLLLIIFLLLIVPVTLIFLFMLFSKSFSWDNYCGSEFECGFTSYYFSRFSFSIHYVFIGLIFLFFDLELCFLMPLMLDLNCHFVSSFLVFFILIFFLMMLGLEWFNDNISWTS